MGARTISRPVVEMHQPRAARHLEFQQAFDKPGADGGPHGQELGISVYFLAASMAACIWPR